MEGPQPAAELLLVARVLQSHLTQSLASGEEVKMAVVEPRHDPAADQVDDARGRPDELPNRGVAADMKDAVAPDGDGFRFGM
jgi:hypothetical protein